MTATWALGAFAGISAVGGLLLIGAGVRGSDHNGELRPGRDVPWKRIGVAAATGLLVLAVTQWVAVALACGAIAWWWRRLFGGARAARVAIDRLEALAAWAESLRDMVSTGAGLPEALPASVAAASPDLVPVLNSLVERLRSREPLESALRAFADELDDASADLVVAALVLNVQAQGRALHAVLSALATSARAELAMRRAVEADRRATRRGVQIVLAVTVFMALGLQLLNPTYVEPYHSAAGQLMLTLIVAIFAAGFVWLQRLSRTPRPARFLGHATAPVPTQSASLTGVGS